MASLIPGFEYDIFISYRQKDNKHDGWVSEFVDNLKGELESTFKEEISIYFDINPQDGLLETYSVDKSLASKLNCLIFIPIISQTYCDSKSFAWENEFCAFNKLSQKEEFGRDIILSSGNVASRILPVKIHDLDPEDKALLEDELGGKLRGIEFIYKSAGVNRPLRANEDHPQDNLNKTYYRDQINKVANAVKEIFIALKKRNQHHEEILQSSKGQPSVKKVKAKIILGTLIFVALLITGYFLINKINTFNTPLEKSIAVLPFNNLSNDPGQEYFSDGMVDAILDHLFKVGELKVISRTSTMRYKKTQLPLKEIAKELGVSAILEGSVQKIGNNVRITAQLIDASTDTHLWSDSYIKAMDDVFSVYSEVAQNIARGLKVTLTSDEARLIKSKQLTRNQLAYDYYLKGNDFSSKSKNALATDMYTQAILEDPLFAEAYAKRAKTYLSTWWNKSGNWQGADLKAKEDIKKVLELNPEITELKLAQAYYHYFINREYDKALKVIGELKSESPNKADLYTLASFVLRRQGKWSESINEAKLGIRLDPYNAESIRNLCQTYELLRQYDNQGECARQGLLLIPDYISFNRHIFNAYLHKSLDLKMAIKESGLAEKDCLYEIYYFSRQYDKLIEFIKNDTSKYANQFIYEPKTYRIAFIEYLKGNKDLCKIYADSAVTELNEKILEFPDDERYYATLGKCYAFIGNEKEALNYGEKAVDLKPMKRDAWQGVVKEQDLMNIYLFTRNNDLAMDKIEYLLSVPSNLYKGDLSINPVYDCVRKFPRFQKILKSEYKMNL